MKKFTTIIFIILGLKLFGQTDSLEKAILYKKFLNDEIPQNEFAEKGSGWLQTMKKIGKYPDLPIDSKGQVHYSYLDSYKGVSKEKLFKRSLEWLSINYGLFPSYLYSNLEDGKIIFSNSFNVISNYSCNYTCIISIKDERILMDFININYQAFYAAHYLGETWIPDKTINLAPNQIFPIVLKKPSEWEFNLNLFITTNSNFNSIIESISDYIVNYDFNYLF